VEREPVYETEALVVPDTVGERDHDADSDFDADSVTV